MSNVMVTRTMVCSRCNGSGTVSVSCDDPQCGDSTWDHYCNEGSEPCPECVGKGLPPRVTMGGPPREP